jgi:hypothetical protein
LFFFGSVIESTTLPITLILSNANYQMQLVIVVDSISSQLPITQLPISARRRRRQGLPQVRHPLLELERPLVGRQHGGQHAQLQALRVL